MTDSTSGSCGEGQGRLRGSWRRSRSWRARPGTSPKTWDKTKDVAGNVSDKAKGDDADDKAEEAGDKAKAAGDDVADKAKAAGEKVGDAAKDVGEKAKAAGRRRRQGQGRR